MRSPAADHRGMSSLDDETAHWMAPLTNDCAETELKAGQTALECAPERVGQQTHLKILRPSLGGSSRVFPAAARLRNLARCFASVRGLDPAIIVAELLRESAKLVTPFLPPFHPPPFPLATPHRTTRTRTRTAVCLSHVAERRASCTSTEARERAVYSLPHWPLLGFKRCSSRRDDRGPGPHDQLAPH